MSESRVVSELVGLVYDAAIDPTLWPGVLEQICKFVDGQAASLFVQDSARPLATLFFNYNNDPEYLQLYQEKYVHMNPLLPGMTFFDIGKVFGIFDVVPEAEFNATRFYTEFAKPQGFVDSLFCNLDKTGTSYAVMSLTRGERHGLVDERARERMSLIVPHVRRAVLIAQLIEQHEKERVTVASLLDNMAASIFLVTDTGQIAFSNARGRIMVAEGRVLRDNRSTLTANDAGANRALHDALAAAGRSDADLGLRGVSIALTPGGGADERWLAHVLPLNSGARASWRTQHSAIAAVFVRRASLDMPAPLEIIAGLYKLTGGEVRVLQAVVDTGGVPEIAEALGISTSTVRTHMRSLFEKTGTHRQADLVKLIAEHASPFQA